MEVPTRTAISPQGLVLHKRVRAWSIWLQGAIAVAAILGVVLGLIYARSTPAGRDSLKIEVAELRSQAAEGRLLAEQAAQGALTSRYQRSAVLQLRGKIESTSMKLQSLRVEPGLDQMLVQARQAAAELTNTIGELLNGAPGPTTGALSRDLASIFGRLMTLETALTNK